MYWTVLLTVLSAVLTYVLGQLVVKLVIEPVQDMKRTIGQISHSLIEHANIIQNPGVPPEEVMKETSQHFRKLSSQIQTHLYLVPLYRLTACSDCPRRLKSWTHRRVSWASLIACIALLTESMNRTQRESRKSVIRWASTSQRTTVGPRS